MALEQSVNRDTKCRGGEIGITKREGALEHWFLTAHERASITSALKSMCGIGDDDTSESHKEGTSSRVLRDESDIQKLISVVTSGLFRNPFEFEYNDNGGDENPTPQAESIAEPLVNIASGLTLPNSKAENLLSAASSGKVQMTTFVEESCKRTACERKGCKCRVLQMPCCVACVCMGKNDCKNPYCLDAQ